MKRKTTIKSSILLLLLLIIVYGCKDAVTNPPEEIDTRNFFPDKEGSYFYYNIVVFDSTGPIQSGTRKSYLQGDTTLQQTLYQVRIDSLELNGNLSISNSFLRKSANGVFSFFDTTGFTAIVPDSLRNLLTISTEYRLLYFPFSIPQTWPVYNVSIDLGISRVDIVRIFAEVIEQDSLTIAIRDTTITKAAYRIKYSMVLITGLDLTTETYTAFAWIMEDTGIYQWEGDAELLTFFTSNTAYPPGTVVLERLTGFGIP